MARLVSQLAVRVIPLCAALTVGCVLGCRGNSEHTRFDAYSIAVKNETGAKLDDVTITFKGSPWRFAFGVVAIDAAAHVGEDPRMPALPDTATISWTDGGGTRQSGTAELTAEGRIEGPGDFDKAWFTIKAPNALSVNWTRY